MQSLRKFLKFTFGESGQALVEMALILPLLLLLLLGVIETSRVLGTYLLMSHSSREGARLAAVGGSDAEVETQVKSIAVLLDPVGLTVNTTPSAPDGKRLRGSMISVSLEYDLDIFLPLPASIIPDPFPLQAQTTMRAE